MDNLCGKIFGIAFFCVTTIVVSWAQPSADFTYQLGASGDQQCTPLTAGFFNNSSADATSFQWYINGAAFSTQENPIRNFDLGGTFLVCLSVENAAMQTDSICKTVVIYDPPTVIISATNNDGCIPISPVVTINSNVEIDSIYVDYGDGQFFVGPGNSTSFSQAHTYDATGTYSVTATVWDVNGCESTVVENNLIQANEIPSPSFNSPTPTGCQLPHVVTFVNSTPNQGSLNFEWFFGDGGTSTDANPTYTYNNFGNYDVILIATNAATGCADTLTMNSFINIGEITQFEWSIIEDGDCSTTQVQFTNLTGGDLTSIVWDFGDGNQSTEPNPTHTYTTAGCFTPSLSISTSDGCNSTRVADSCISSIGPVTLGYTTTGTLETCDPTAGLVVSFQANSSPAANYSWDFGGIGSATGPNASFSFNQYGVFPVTLTAEFSNGCIQTVVEDTVIIQGITPVFVADTFSGCIPLPIQFTNLTTSPDPIVSYNWDFEFTTSTVEHPNIIIPDTGIYDVTLTVTTVAGCVGTVTYPNYIRAGIQPQMDFEVDPTIACIDTIISFTDLTSYYTTDWYWRFGDGGQSYEQNPSHEYNDTGFFDITLIAWFNGCADTLARPNHVEIKPPIANWSYAQDCANPYTIVFSDNSVGADVYLWDFGDGQTSTDSSPTHTYTNHGIYTVELTVTNLAEGCDDVFAAIVSITDADIDVSIGPPNLICRGDSIQVQNNTTGAIAYAWNIPDSVDINTSGSVSDPFLIFNESGVFSGFEMTIADANGCIDTVAIPSVITVSGIDVNLTYDRFFGCPPLTVNFNADAQSYFGNIIGYEWDFGDSNSSTDQNPTHTFVNEGLYTITLSVTNDEGCTETRTFNNLIDVSVPVASYTNYLSDCVDYEHTFINTSAGNHLSHYWDFGDGDTSSLVNPVHSFQDTGTYIVCLTVTNGPGCDDTYCDTVVITEIRADFSGDNLYKSCPFPPLVTNFTDESVGAVEWLWDFGDDTGLSTLQNPTHAYSRAGIFTVCLIVTDALGCRDTLCRPDYIQVDGPDGSFTSSSEGGCNPVTVDFSAIGENVAIYNWDFGDGTGQFVASSDTTNMVSHTYTAPGKYVPVLILEDPAGCLVPYRGDTITVEELSIGLNSNIQDLCHTVDSLVDFTADINYFGTLDQINWTFPGANPGTANGDPINGVIFSSPGTYDVSLQVTTTYCDVSITEPNYITVHPRPEPAFTFTPGGGCEPLQIAFTDQSTIAFDNIVQWEWDFGDGVTSTDQNPTHVFQEDGTYTVRLTATSDAGCSHFVEQQIVVDPLPIVEIGPAPHLCIGESFQIETTLLEGDTVTYSWTPTTNLSCTDCPNPITSPTDTTLYVLTVTNQFGCTSTESILVTAGPYSLPVISMNQDTAICQGTELDILVNTDVSPAQFSWDTSQEGLSCTDCPNPVASPTTPTTYVVYVIGPGNCTSVDSVSVDILIENIGPLGEDRTICEGGSVELPVLEGTNPIWSPGNSLSCSDCLTPTASPTVTTTYQLSVTGNFGCTVNDSVTVNVMTPDDVYAGADTSICFEDVFIPNATFSGNSVWTLDGQVVATNEMRPSLSPQADATYEVVVTNDLCVLSDQVSVTVYGPTTLASQGGLICEGDSIQLTATGNGTIYTWTPETGLSNPNIANPMASPEVTTTYTVTSSVEGCWPISEQVTVTVNPLPTPYPQRSINFKRGEIVQLDANVEQGSGGYVYDWRPATYLSCNDCERPLATPDTSVNYEVWVEDQFGCVDSAMVRLNLLNICSPEIFVMPNAFTPDDDGQNDFLQVLGNAEVTLFQVYNRWGELVYSDNGGGRGWDGSFRGKKLNRDVFVYYIEGICPFTGGPVSRSGDVMLLR